MNPIALINNFNYSLQVCPSWSDRWNRLAWLYSDKPLIRLRPVDQRQITFVYAAPVNTLKVVVRDNKDSDAFIFSEVFDHSYYDFSLPFEPTTILDLGANIGFTAIFLACKYPLAQIACVEPMPENVKLLQENIDLNNIACKVFPSAIATDDGMIQMQIDAMDYGHKVAGMNSGEIPSDHILEVEAISIPTLLQQLDWQRISLLKVDIEGYEAILLRENCNWLTRVDAMCIECHDDYGASDLQQLATQWGFSAPQKLPGTWLLVREQE